MWTFLAGMGGKVAAIGTAIVAALGALAMIRRSGVQAQQNADLKKEVKDDATAGREEAAVYRMDSDAVQRGLHEYDRK